MRQSDSKKSYNQNVHIGSGGIISVDSNELIKSKEAKQQIHELGEFLKEQQKDKNK